MVLRTLKRGPQSPGAHRVEQATWVIGFIGGGVGVTAEYGYNHLHQRVTKTLNGHTRLMLYDQAGSILSEVDSATGQTLAEYVWLDGAPLAYIEAGNTYQIHVDHLATPQVLTDGTGQVAWEAHYTPFGRAAVISQGPTFNLRFPGQYFDDETGLHYNWHRYYDPAIGRFITSDPIGLAGGLNTYGYAYENPVMTTDPTGQCPPCIAAVIAKAGIAYAAFEIASTVYDTYVAVKTSLDPGASTEEKVITAGSVVMGSAFLGLDGSIRKARMRPLKESGLFRSVIPTV